RIHLEKNLPIASGIGGGSADAAATLRGLTRLWGATLPEEALAALALKLGADVPMFLESRPLIARGIGEGEGTDRRAQEIAGLQHQVGAAAAGK
ncbi:GHMP family kinase ATP-binding protein, partial [Rhizobium johnstonii]|uniref:GHMP family kinase ATP-binding protein n=1 Tax=Rhizobium johnstonii TaxID=3019933 RepID=UPI003F9E9F9D